MTKSRGVLLVGAVALSVLGCPQHTAVWAAPQASADNLVFHVGRSRGDREKIPLSGFGVERCEGSAERQWVVFNSGGADLDIIVYGEVPNGFEQTMVARPLDGEECYTLWTTGTGVLHFYIAADGGVVEVEQVNGVWRPR